MKQLATLFVISLFAACPALADPIEGLWRTAPDDHGDIGFIRVGSCGASYCGVLERAENAQGKAIQPDTLGRKIVWNLTHSKSNEYQGRIYAPDRDKEYMSKLELSGNSISVNGCILGGLVCRNGGQWTRVQ